MDAEARPFSPLPMPLMIALAGVALLAVLGATVITSGLEAIRPLYALSGALVGLLVGLTGVGGGSLMTPLLILVFGMHPASAVGTDLLYASATKAVGSGVHAANRNVDWRLVRRMAMGSVPATLLTILAMQMLHLGADKASQPLSILLGVVLLLTSGSLLLRGRLTRMARARAPDLTDDAAAGRTFLLGAVLGVLITLTSVGAGALGVTVLVFLYPRMPIARIVGSDIVHAVPLTLIAGAGHWMLGGVDLSLLASLLLGSIPGIVVGSLLTPKVPERVLRLILASVLVLVGVKLIL